MDATFLNQLLNRKDTLEAELRAIDTLLALHQDTPAKKPRRGRHVNLPQGARCKTVIDIATGLYEQTQRPVTIDEVNQELRSRGYRVPHNGHGHVSTAAYLHAGKQMKREGKGYVPA